MADDRSRDPGADRHREPRLRDIARRLMREVEDAAGEDRPRNEDRPRGEERSRMDAREVLGAVLETGDKAKTEVVRMVAREVRNYLEELRAGEALHDLLTNYSVEVHASFHLRPLAEHEKAPGADDHEPQRTHLRRKRAAKPEPEPDDEADGAD